MAEQEESKITFFSEVDYNNGKIASEFPAWYQEHMKEELIEEVRRIKFQLDNDLIPKGSLQQANNRLKVASEKLDKIESSIPKFEGKQKDKIAKVCKTLGEEITRAMDSYTVQRKGLSDAHRESKRIVLKAINVTPEIAEMAEACNVRIVDGKVSRKDCEKMWKIGRKAIGEISNTEYLRKD